MQPTNVQHDEQELRKAVMDTIHKSGIPEFKMPYEALLQYRQDYEDEAKAIELALNDPTDTRRVIDDVGREVLVEIQEQSAPAVAKLKDRRKAVLNDLAEITPPELKARLEAYAEHGDLGRIAAIKDDLMLRSDIEVSRIWGPGTTQWATDETLSITTDELANALERSHIAQHLLVLYETIQHINSTNQIEAAAETQKRLRKQGLPTKVWKPASQPMDPDAIQAMRDDGADELRILSILYSGAQTPDDAQERLQSLSDFVEKTIERYDTAADLTLQTFSIDTPESIKPDTVESACFMAAGHAHLNLPDDIKERIISRQGRWVPILSDFPQNQDEAEASYLASKVFNIGKSAVGGPVKLNKPLTTFVVELDGPLHHDVLPDSWQGYRVVTPDYKWHHIHAGTDILQVQYSALDGALVAKNGVPIFVSDNALDWKERNLIKKTVRMMQDD